MVSPSTNKNRSEQPGKDKNESHSSANMAENNAAGYPPGYDLDADLDHVTHEGEQMRRALAGQIKLGKIPPGEE